MRPIFGPYSNQKFPSGPSVSAPPVGISLTTLAAASTTVTGYFGGSSPNDNPRDTQRCPSTPVTTGPAARSESSGKTLKSPAAGLVPATAACAGRPTAAKQTTSATNLPIPRRASPTTSRGARPENGHARL